MKAGRLWALLLCTSLMLWAAPASAHKSSDAYLQIASGDHAAAGLTVRLDIALRDLDVALDLDRNGDGKLTWAEVKTAWPQIERYSLARLQIEGCPLRPTRRALERRNDGAYAAMFLASDCRLSGAPRIAYTVLREVDPTHRGIARIQLGGGTPTLRVLDPTQPDVISAGAVAAGAASGAAAPGHSTDALAGLGLLREGVMHILTGYDHVLFLVCLLLPSVMRRTSTGWAPVPRLSEAVLPMLGVVTSFTLAHSITLALAALKIVSLPPSVIEPGIAVTIMLAALDNLYPIFRGRRVIVTFLFGLIHGFGFAGVLAELNLQPGQFAWALLQFNVGIELGQFAIVCIVISLLYLIRHRPRYPGWVIGGGSCSAIVVGGAWFVERTANISLLPF